MDSLVWGRGVGSNVAFLQAPEKKKKAARLEARPLRWNTCHTWFALICVVAVTSRSPSNALVAPADGPLSYRGPLPHQPQMEHPLL